MRDFHLKFEVFFKVKCLKNSALNVTEYMSVLNKFCFKVVLQEGVKGRKVLLIYIRCADNVNESTRLGKRYCTPLIKFYIVEIYLEIFQ